jgi:hypothetical protein
MVTRYTGGNIHNFKTALTILLVGILLGTAAAVSTPFANQEGVVRRLNEKQEYVSILLPDHTYGIVQKPAHSAPAAEFAATQGAPSLLQDQAMQDHSPRESANITPPRSDFCSQEWVGGCIGPCSTDTRPRRHHLVVSHCTHDRLQTWLNINRITFETITVVSKCGRAVTPALNEATVVRIPNVGRCDHAYAWWMAQHAATLGDDDIVQRE